MKSDNTVYKATEKASGASKREGKWANLSEIKRKTPPVFKAPVRPALTRLVRQDSIEKKKKAELWRPRREAAGGGGKTVLSDKLRDRRRDTARMVAGGAVGGAVRSSVMRSIF